MTAQKEEMSDVRIYERNFQYRESQGKVLVSGSKDEREKGCKNSREESRWEVYFFAAVFAFCCCCCF